MLEKNGIPLFDLSKRSAAQIVEDENISLFFEPSNVDYKRLCDIKCHIVGTLHGLRTLETPVEWNAFLYKLPIKEFFKHLFKRVFTNFYHQTIRTRLKPLLESSNIRLVTVSRHSASSFKVFFPQSQTDIPVFYSASTSVINTSLQKYCEKYFLLVSANRTYKNNLRAIIALDKLFSMGYMRDFRVKVTGIVTSKAFWYKIKNREKFDFLGFVDEKELDQLYHDAYCFIYPTLNEGFGYPPLEAMHYGVPVLSSPLSSIPEVCGGNVIYFNPFSVEEMMNRILMILDDKVHKKYSRLSRERYEVITQKQNKDLDGLIDYIYSFIQ